MSDFGIEVEMDGNADTTLDVGSDAPSFDDLDRLESSRNEYKEQKKKDAKGSSEPESKKATEKKAEKKPDGEPKKGTESDKKADTEKVDTPSEKEVKKAIKMLKGKVGEDLVDLNPDTVLTHKVDGQPVDVTVQQLLNDYSGRESWDKKFSELDKDRQTFTGERDKLSGYLQKFGGTIQQVMAEDFSGDPTTAFDSMLDLMGETGHNLRTKIRDYYTDVGSQLAEMDEGERSAFLLQQENAYLKNRAESFESQRKQEQSSMELKRQVAQIREAHGVSEEQFSTAMSELEGLGYKDLGPEQVIEYHKTVPHVNRAENLVKSLSQDLDAKTYTDTVHSVAELSKAYPDTTDQEIIAALKDEFGITKKIMDVNKKVGQTERSTVDNTSPSGLPSGRGYESFDDYDEYSGY